MAFGAQLGCKSCTSGCNAWDCARALQACKAFAEQLPAAASCLVPVLLR